jgi:hypothetical protein
MRRVGWGLLMAVTAVTMGVGTAVVASADPVSPKSPTEPWCEPAGQLPKPVGELLFTNLACRAPAP